MGLFDFLKPKKNNTPKSSRNSKEYSVLNNNFKAASKQDALNRYNYLIKEQKYIQSTLDRHQQIINESLDIIYKSKNLNTIKSRYNVIYENFICIKTIKQQGYSVNFDDNFTKKLGDEYNNVIINLAKSKIDEYEVKINTLKTEKAKDNQTSKIYSFIDEVSKSFKSPRLEHHQAVKDLKNRIEDIYS